jgi:aspartyl/glutamyl-tRNA(Asn/Gln) amidotransferase C subunit
MITKNDILALAELALIEVTEEECETLASEVGAMVGYVSEIETCSGLQETTPQKQEHRNVMRDDVITNSPREYTEAIVAQFPERSDDRLEVPKIL